LGTWNVQDAHNGLASLIVLTLRVMLAQSITQTHATDGLWPVTTPAFRRRALWCREAAPTGSCGQVRHLHSSRRKFKIAGKSSYFELRSISAATAASMSGSSGKEVT
jgi:hypothetical protein